MVYRELNYVNDAHAFTLSSCMGHAEMLMEIQVPST